MNAKWIAVTIVLVALIGLGWAYRADITGSTPETETEHADHVAHYTCPMHPSVKAAEPGACPVCGMDLVAVPAADAAGGQMASSDMIDHSGHDHGDVDHYTCPMHPSVKAAEPGACPICGMDLVPVPKAGGGGGQVRGPDLPPFISLNAWQEQLIGVTTDLVARREMKSTVRTVGRIDYDETKLADVNLKVSGWVRDLFVDYTGKPVRKGQPLFTLYSPELVSTQEEYLLSLRTIRRLEAAGKEGAKRQDVSALERTRMLLESTRQRLLFWDLTPDQIQGLDRSGQPQTTVTIHAPASGVVTQKMAVGGMYVNPGMRLYRIARLDTVWVYADVYEYELPFVEEGQSARITLSYENNGTYHGLVDYVYPSLDPKSRTAKVRVQVPNTSLKLKPEMFVNVLFDVDMGEQLVIPEAAVLFSGKRRVVFVEHGRGRYEPREVGLGALMGDHYHVLAGLHEGERVATSANFLLDSESKLKNVTATKSGGHHNH